MRCPRIVGREVELDRVTAVVARAQRRHGSAVFVGGEAGVGKTRLVEEAEDRARRSGVLVLSGHASIADRDSSFLCTGLTTTRWPRSGISWITSTAR
jgi:predicted ATPase